MDSPQFSDYILCIHVAHKNIEKIVLLVYFMTVELHIGDMLKTMIDTKLEI
jgi:hypothetical protein